MELISILDALGLSEEDYRSIVKILGRPPTRTELAMFSVEWSEHCSYRRSKKWLKQFPKEGPFPVLIGDDAGGFLLGELAVVFKVESHNHPSQIEPLHGAATGVGGIIRDIIGSGAKPIALLDSLRFGPLDTKKCRDIFTGVVDGIQWYGNSVGVPTVGGEIYFHPGYETNCLVNVMCVGIAPKEQLITSRARPSCLVLYLGARTGRDGIGGCSVLASQELAQELAKRPTVQIGDPFFGKCLIEATLESLERQLFVALKDMGAAGLTCTTTEMSAAGECGMTIDLSKVPAREEGMEPYEIMMSESQERMLAVVAPGKEEEVIKVFKKWGLEAEVLGKTISDSFVQINMDGKEVACVPVRAITTPPPIELPIQEQRSFPRLNNKIFESLKTKITENSASHYLLSLLAVPSLASKRSVWEQYDHMVQTNTVIGPQCGDTAVLRIKGRPEALAVTIDGNPIYTYLDPYMGAQIAVAEAARNIVTTGAVPAAVTDGLNFGTPEKPDRFWSFVRATEGIRDACKELGLPVVSGNVSFYNETEKAVIPPTPIIGMVGVIENVEQAVSNGFKDIGDLIILIGETKPEFGGSQIQLLLEGKESGRPPEIDWKVFKALIPAYHDAVRKGMIKSAHDCSEGGAGVAIAESSLIGNKGAAIQWLLDPVLLFSETQSRIIVSINKNNYQAFKNIFTKQNVLFTLLGEVVDSEQGLTIYWDNSHKRVNTIELLKLRKSFEETIPSIVASSF